MYFSQTYVSVQKTFFFKELKYIDFTKERVKATSIAEKRVRTTTFFYLFLTLWMKF